MRNGEAFVSILNTCGVLNKPGASSSQRASSLPNVPTTIEAGFPNSEYNFWIGVFAPSKTPGAIQERLHKEIAAALANPAVAEKLKKLGADPMKLSAGDFRALISKEIVSNAELVKAAGIDETFSGPNDEPRGGMPVYEVKSAPVLAERIRDEGVRAGYDIATLRDFSVDHSVMVPLHFVNPGMKWPVIPFFISGHVPPLPPARRCFDLGRQIRATIEAWPENLRVAIIGTGSFSLEVFGPRIRPGFIGQRCRDPAPGGGQRFPHGIPRPIRNLRPECADLRRTDHFGGQIPRQSMMFPPRS